MEIQASGRVLMVRPATFYYNPETAENNSFQVLPSATCSKSDIHSKAVSEFFLLVKLLREEGIVVEVIEEEKEPLTSDSIFPNNWISFHSEKDSLKVSPGNVQEYIYKTAVLYPMWSENRRLERKKLFQQAFQLLPLTSTILDLSPLESSGNFLEGTGSMVLDRTNRIAYACLSPRTTFSGLHLFCKRMSYKALPFTGLDSSGKPCYHTNVMMSIADKYCLICLDAIPSLGERVKVEVSLTNSGKLVIPLTLQQMSEFAGNCLQLQTSHQTTILVMSSRAYASLTEEQISKISQFNKILHSDVSTIESFGGGSVRCMIAEMGEPCQV